MESRRQFIKKASALAGATAVVNWLPESIQRALAIEAPLGSTYMDAEHIVFLMQENRSFDHCFGTLKGVRGFNDPRALKLPNGLPVWIQGNKKGEYFAPFHLDIVNSKSTWMGSLPHGWRDMVAARNDGRMDNWLEAKSSGIKDYKAMPLTMGYYNRADLPFYYAFADAFTVCDQHFCSSLTGTSANRSYFWTGTVRENPRDPESTAHVDNGQINYKDVSWKSYPERLEESGVSWKVYQNELSIPVGFEGEEEDWLANFTDNNLEFHKQYGVRYHPAHRTWMEYKLKQLEKDVIGLKDSVEESKLKKQIEDLKQDLQRFSKQNFEKLSDLHQAIHKKAFVTNIGDPDYHRVEKLVYEDSQGKQEVDVPAGDVFYQFRKDVKEKNLPTVSWLVAPCRFSDHPGSPWYGAWYVSEALDILTKDPEVWKKTIFILTYDENDGYFDHISPFVPPLEGNKDSGKTAVGIHTADEYVTKEQERRRTGKTDSELESPIGLGFRVPLVIASPWSKGGWVNSEVFDHTSCLQFLEQFLLQKTGKDIKETNISSWRRLVCGDLNSVFRKVTDTSLDSLVPVNRDQYVERIYSARAKKLPTEFVQIAPSELDQIRKKGLPTSIKAIQEKGIKQACALPYALEVNAELKHNSFEITFETKVPVKSKKKIGVPFQVRSQMAYGKVGAGQVWNFAVKENEPLRYAWHMDQLKGDSIEMELHGPNGFFRMFKLHKEKPHAIIVKQYHKKNTIALELKKINKGHSYLIKDGNYDCFEPFSLDQSFSGTKILDFSKSHGWYDLEITCKEDPEFCFVFAGHIENGMPSKTDPLMGDVVNHS
ncbi:MULTISPECIES: phosphocholine-specific phospholipase C [unclassified Sphingobacterium]|uniref:phosphocholine-specific phospholipase C n=1 Tax=unclassified Sphingobacterium TaxID=2609468 RepID=UPI0010F12D09|nr:MULTISPECIES: phospholipase C, phosphocholine-specific [unclassified Sphingobacterium]MCS3554978.1 phospholipase C [Sphingobacterium sp. JUb21]TCR05625.1 phospholipase C [Sphingobacterium sp. JUb20]